MERLGLACLEETIIIYLLNSGFKYKQLFKQQVISEDNKFEKVIWSLEYLEFPLWDHVVFPDEAGFWLGEEKGRGWFPKRASTEEIEEAGKGKVMYGARSHPEEKWRLVFFTRIWINTSIKGS